MYLGCNMSVAQFQKPEVLQALKWAIDYEAIATNITPNVWTPCQTFLPKGSSWSRIADEPYKKDVAKAKALLAKAGLPGRLQHHTRSTFPRAPFPDVAQAIQANLAESASRHSSSPVRASRSPPRCGHASSRWTLMTWFPNSDHAPPTPRRSITMPMDFYHRKVKLPAWRCHFHDKELTDLVDKASKELDAKKRMEMYAKMQRELMERSPFVFVLQRTRKSPPCTRACPASLWDCCPITRAMRASARRDLQAPSSGSCRAGQRPGDAVRPGAGDVPDWPAIPIDPVIAIVGDQRHPDMIARVELNWASMKPLVCAVRHLPAQHGARWSRRLGDDVAPGAR